MNHQQSQLNRKTFLDDNPDWKDFAFVLSDDTVNDLSALWISNVRANRGQIRKHGMAADKFLGIGREKCCVIIGASPGLSSNVQEFKAIVDDPNFILFATSSSLKFLLRNGITPKFVVMADGAKDVSSKINIGCQSANMTLIASCFVHPESLRKWEGLIRFVRVGIDRNFHKEYSRITGERKDFPAGGTQFNLAFLVAYIIFGCRTFIFTGNELCYDYQYYVDRADYKDTSFDKYPALDIHGEEVFTNLSFMQSKLYLETQTGKWDDGVYINSSEGGILGVSSRYGRLPWILQMRLRDSIGSIKNASKKVMEVKNNGKINRVMPYFQKQSGQTRNVCTLQSTGQHFNYDQV
jgi:hypothetical protein